MRQLGFHSSVSKQRCRTSRILAVKKKKKKIKENLRENNDGGDGDVTSSSIIVYSSLDANSSYFISDHSKGY